MTSRKRKNISTSNSLSPRAAQSGGSSSSRSSTKRSSAKRLTGKKRRQGILETLESRHLFAGPQLIGIQPNEGTLVVSGTDLSTAPRVLTLRFDANQQIDATTLDGIRVTRAGNDGLLNTNDDIRIVPGLVSVGDPKANEVQVRFSETLPNDKYKLEVFGFDDDGLGITGLRNRDGELFVPRIPGQRAEVTEFDLKLGAQIESIVPQPIVRLSDGSIRQNRNEIVVYFNEDPLFVEDDSAIGQVEIGNQRITVNGTLTKRAFDDTRIVFNQSTSVASARAVHDSVAHTITVTYPNGSSYSQISSAINAISDFSAAVTAGDPGATFVAPANQNFAVKGNPTERSAENPRFYQLLLTRDTVRTTDDSLYYPDEVVYDSVSHTARLFFLKNADGSPVSDINLLGPDKDGNPGVPLSGGTFRLRIGTAVDDRVDVILPPVQAPVAANTSSDFGIADFKISFISKAIGESGSGRQVRFENTGAGGLTVRLDSAGAVVFDLGGSSPVIGDLGTVVAATPSVDAVVRVVWQQGGVFGAGSSLAVPSRVVGAPALTMTAVGDTIGSSLDVGVFGADGRLTSLVFRESIDPLSFVVQLPGGNDDPGHIEIPEIAGNLLQHINDNFGPDSTDGITEIAYNFNGIFDRDLQGNNFLNQIDERQKTRIREALGLWSNSIGVQFRETPDQGITFAFGDTADLQPKPGIFPVSQSVLGARLRIDPTFAQSAIVFSSEVNFQLSYGEDFLRKAMAGIGLILGLEQAPDLPEQTLMALSSRFLNDTINPTDPLPSQIDPLLRQLPQSALRDLEPVFPGNYDVLHGNYLHRSDSVDVDLYRFEVNLGDDDRVGTLTAETFAERLADSSLLDTTLTLFQEKRASIVTDFGVGVDLQVRIDSLLEATAGNNSRIDLIKTDRPTGDSTVRISRRFDSAGNLIANAIFIDMPRVGGAISSVPVSSVIDAINNDPFASSIFRATLLDGSASTDVGQSDLNVSPLLLKGGGLQQLNRNDDYFSEDSRIIASLSEGVYYIGVASSGNDHYDPTVPGSSIGGRTQGAYELHLKFEPQVDEVDVIRDEDSDRVDVPGTPLDGDGDGRPGGVNNFWFQTRPLSRLINFTDNGTAVTAGQTITVTGSTGVLRRYEFVQIGGTARAGNVPVFYNPGTSGTPTDAAGLASALATAVNSRVNETGVSMTSTGSVVTFAGERSVALSSNFRGGEIHGRTIFVDKVAGPFADGSLSRPFNNIANSAVANAYGAAIPGDIVRIVGNGGNDGNLTTEADNFSYKIGVSDTGGQPLEDGITMEVPKGVTTMVDAGAAFKLRNARIGIGSSSVQADRSGGALQVMGTPRLVQLSLQGSPIVTTILGAQNTDQSGIDDGKVIFTSTRDRLVDAAAAGNNPAPSPGNWGGIRFSRDVDLAEGRRDLEDEGIFLQHVNHADIRYGGSSNLLIDSVQQTVNPIQIVGLRPTITFNEILFSADAAISAAPNSFEETSFQAPRFQINGAFTADYSRVGPDIHGNTLIDNSVNGLFIRSTTTPVSTPELINRTVRFDDTGIVHVIAENLLVQGNPGGSINDGFSPNLSAVSGREISGGRLQPARYQYRMTFVDDDGFESLSTTDVNAFNLTVTRANSSIELVGLPVVGQSAYLSRRLYRANLDAGATPVFELVTVLDASTVRFVDNGSTLGGTLNPSLDGTRGRLDGSLVFDPGIVVKLQGSRIELGQGAQMLAEGTEQNPIVFTSTLDDRYGAGGTFDTNNDNKIQSTPAVPSRGNWSGLYAGPTSRISIDNSIVAYAGGISLLEGDSRGFAPVELQQATGRVTNTRFESNDDGQDGSGPVGRKGLLGITPATIFVRGAQPIIVGNQFVDNRGTIIAIDSDSMTADYIRDSGRHTGTSNLLRELDDNQGPLIRNNRYQNVPADDNKEKQISGLDIRGGNLTTESVWDDTDIVHLISDSIVVGNFHSSGGLLLKSRPDESLVVKMTGAGTPNSPTLGTGFTATGTPGSISDRIGGTIHVVGLPGAPVVLTSFKDDTVGAGLSPDGSQFTDTNGDSFGSRPEPNDWRSILLDQWSNDRNVDFILEQELPTSVAPGFNGTVQNAQVLGELAANIDVGDDVRRIGFEVEGFLSGPTDVDVYSFVGSPGTEVWIDIDKTHFQLDTVIELLDVNGNLIGRSDNSFAEIAGTESVLSLAPEDGNVGTLQSRADAFTKFGPNGLYDDFSSTNPRDAGLRLTLPGTQSSVDSRSVYFFRVRSASLNPDDAAGGLTKGGYRFQVRLQEDQEFSGSVVRFADIRFANHGVHVRGLPGESPLLGDAQENEGSGGFFFGATGSNDVIDPSSGSFTGVTPPGDRPQNLGNLVGNKKNVISVGGRLDTGSDVDFYQVDLDFGLNAELYHSTVFDVDFAGGSRPDTNLSVFYDPDGEFGPQSPRLVLFGQDANIAEDRSSPLGENSPLERLLAGSTNRSDAFIGPVSLPEGSYYVAVTDVGSIPTELTNNTLVRREPINSVQRLVEDRVDPSAPSTASGPRLAELFTDTAIAAGGFVSTTARGDQAGHGPQQNFDNSNRGVVVPETIYREGTPPLPANVGGSPFLSFDADTLNWSIADNNEIGGVFTGGVFGGGSSENTSTLIPHVTIDASMAVDAADFFRIVVPQDGTRVIVDVDRGFNPFQGIDDNDPLTPPFRPDPNSIDVDLVLIQPALTGGFAFTRPRIVNSNPNDGREGSAPVDLNNDGVVDTPLNSLDPFFDGVLNAGTYFIGIVAQNTTVTIADNGSLTITNDNLPLRGTYRVHLSVEDHALPVTVSGNQSLFFQRAPSTTGSLVSEAFDLSGYSADDQPRFYYNYLLNSSSGDQVTYTVTSDQNPGGRTFSNFVSDQQWRQNIVNLNSFAGHSNVRVTFNYTSGSAAGGEGLYLDDFIVGFAERGETVFNARGGEDSFSFGFGNSGEYQLEVRPGTEFAIPNPSFFGSGQTLTRDFDTNDRHSQSITLVAPPGSQLKDGDTFTISDGSVTQRFEFTTDAFSDFNNQAIRFSIGDSSVRIAQLIRAAINQSATLDVEAASASGIDTGTMLDNRLNLFGALSGSFLVVDSPDQAPPALSENLNGDLMMPAVLHDGVGDANYRRIQSAVIIENNTISDARAIGIWSEPGDRDVDPEDLRAAPLGGFFPGFGSDPFEPQPITNPHPFLQQIPVGNVYPGAVRNLPTLNNSVLGGLAPGVVVRNNTVDQAGLAGVKIDGETRPFVIDGMDGTVTPAIADGTVMAIDAGGTRVVFEFEDISGAPTAANGSGVIGGDGFVDGHVPIYYRRIGGGDYNNSNPGTRNYAYSSWELMNSIHQSIQGSILVTNGLAELVTPYLGPSLNSRDEFAEEFARTPEAFPTAAVYLTGVSNIYFSFAYAKGGGAIPDVSLAPVGEAVQPLAKVINNTIYGADGIESQFVGNPRTEGNDIIANAVVTHAGRAHTGPFIANAAIGDIPPGLITPVNDVDMYRVELSVGDRLIVDVDTVAGGPNTSIRIFDELGNSQTLAVVNGIAQTVNRQGLAPSHLDPQSSLNNPVNDVNNTIDPFIDFTALKTGTYFVAISSDGNDAYDPNSLSGRTGGGGGLGDYQVGIEVYTPRSWVMSIDNKNENQIGNNLGTKAGALLGTTFTVTQIPDFQAGVLSDLSGPNPNTNGNKLTFEFSTTSDLLVLPNGNINVALLTTGLDGGYRVPDIMQAIARTVTGLQVLAEQIDIPMLGNHEDGNGPDGRSGPITRGRAYALGGIDGDNLGISNLSARPNGGFGFPLHWLLQNDSDFILGFGHDRKENGNLSVVPANTLTDGFGTTELYVLWENIAEIELSPAARAAGLRLTPDAATPEFAQNADQLITEAGIWVAGGASPTLLNNVISNVHQSVLAEESSQFGFGKRVRVFGDEFVKPQDIVLTGSVFQHDESRNSQIRYDLTWPVDVESPFDVFDTSLSTDDVVGATNVDSQSDDFNFVLANNASLFVSASGNEFLPAPGSILIDSALNSLNDRDAYATAKASIGLPSTNVLAPTRDVRGVLRADNPNFATPGGLGFSVFKDRGSNELADFVGPVASTDVVRDNDADGIDVDPAISFINASDGVYKEFRIQLRDTGDESDPFAGFGMDDRTVVVPEIPGLRASGANLTLFEDGRLLAEGIDYTFNYDRTKKLITLTPLAGIWREDRAYRIELNNQSRTVLIAPDPSTIADGDKLQVTDTNGGTLVFEFESGYSLFVPEAVTLVVPSVGTNAGGVRDGDIFRINDGTKSVIFEFNQDSATLPGTIPVALPTRPTPTVPSELAIFLTEIANNIASAVQGQIDAGILDVDVRVLGTSVVIGGEPGARAETSQSGLQQPARTLALQVPIAGVGPAGIRDGDLFVIDNGSRSVTFEFDTGNGLNTRTNTVVDIAGISAAADVAKEIRDTVSASLGLNASIVSGGLSVYLNLPTNGSAVVPQGQLSVVGVSRPAGDADLIVITPNDGSPQITLEINRTDELDSNGNPMNDGVTAPNVPINITRSTTANELAGRISNAIKGLPPVAGLNPDDLQVINGGLLTIGGEEGLGFAVTGTSLEVTGSPAVTGASRIQVFGPLLLSLPLVGGGGILDGSVMVLKGDTGNDVIFEFNLNNTPKSLPQSVAVPYDTFSTVDVVANNLVAAINGQNLGITAQNQGLGVVSLGRIEQSRVDIDGITNPNNPTQTVPGLAGATLRRGIVRDAEVMTIRQGSISVNYEFDSVVGGGGVTSGNVVVAFQPGSTPGAVAVVLAAAINNNKRGLQISATAELDANGVPTGQVLLDDQPGTIIDVTRAPTLSVDGVPGGATPIRISPAFSAVEVKQAMINAINSVNTPGQPPATTLSAEDRGGATLFVSNGVIFSGPIANYALPAIADLAGNPLEANRSDLSTQFTILMPSVGLDFTDAPDPVSAVRGRYPTRNVNDGPRHVVDGRLFLGGFVDVDVDGVPGATASGDDLTIAVSEQGDMFLTSVINGAAQIIVNTSVNPLLRDGDTITIDTGVAVATLEFDVNGRFDEDNYAIRPSNPTSAASIAEAIAAAIAESPLESAGVTVTGGTVLVNSDDEDGVIFTSPTNPSGVLNHGMSMPIDVSVTGAGILEAWIDFNADGDWDDPGEQIIPMSNDPIVEDRRIDLCPANLTGTVSNIFADAGAATERTFCIVVPPTAPVPPGPLTTYARFRVSREGGLTPNGLALSGEVEDYAIQILPGLPPQIGDEQASRTYESKEDVALLVLDSNGQSTPSNLDNGILAGIVDPDGDAIAVYSEDVGTRTLTTLGGEVAGELNLASDGTFTFLPAADFFGVVTFSARVTDIDPFAPETELVSSVPVNVTINVQPVNDAPIAVNQPVEVDAQINEDEPRVFTAGELISPFFVPGPDNEAGQPMLIQSAGSSNGPFTTELGGTVFIASNGQSVTYTPPKDFSSTTVRDRFTYTVADDPGPGQLSRVSPTIGTVEIVINSVNDPPRAGDDNFATPEGTALVIAITGPTGILANDTPGPQDEIDQGQTVSFVSSDATSLRGGTIVRQGNNLIYTPAFQFGGIDEFNYVIQDNLGASAVGKVRITVADQNNPPTFIGINGSPGLDELAFFESKKTPQVFTYNLNSWFREPDGEAMTFAVTSSDSSIVLASVNGSTLRLELPSFKFGEVTLNVTAIDPANNRTTAPISVTVTNTPDPPVVTGSLGPININEDTSAVRTLSDVFSDPDNDVLTYRVARLDNLMNPTAQQIANHPLVRVIEFVGDQMRILLQPNKSGTAEIEISATDGTFTVSDAFTLTVQPVPDRPVAVADSYTTNVGSKLQVLDPLAGLLKNDFDVDGDAITVDVASIVGPSKGTLSVNPNGTFVYTSTTARQGDVDSFTYRVRDITGLFSDRVTVSIAITASQYQNPLAGLREDVNADGKITAIDALRVINFLDRRLIDSGLSVPVSEIGSPPPDFYDVDGNGAVSSLDALNVINKLAVINDPQRESLVTLAVTSSFAMADASGLPIRNLELVPVEVGSTAESASIEQSLDLLLTGGVEIAPAAPADWSDWIADTRKESSAQDVDDALALLMDEAPLG